MTAVETRSLWNWAVAAYGRPGVGEACRRLHLSVDRAALRDDVLAGGYRLVEAEAGGPGSRVVIAVCGAMIPQALADSCRLLREAWVPSPL